MATTNQLEKLSTIVGGFEQSTWIKEAKERKENSEEILVRQKIALHILRTLRKTNISQKQLAEMLQVSPQQVNKWVKGTENFALSTLLKIGYALGTTLIEVTESKPILQTSELFRSSRAYQYVQVTGIEQFLVKRPQNRLEKNEKYSQPRRLAFA